MGFVTAQCRKGPCDECKGMLRLGWGVQGFSFAIKCFTPGITDSSKVPPPLPLLMAFIEQLFSNNLVKFPMCFFQLSNLWV